MKLADLDINKAYTYADYLKWTFEERVELIKGKLFKMSPAPGTRHQLLTGELYGLLWTFLHKRPCKVFIAPFDVRLTRRAQNDTDVTTVVQPDICVVCDPSKIEARGCIGAPDIVVEVLSPGNNTTELRDKYNIYEESGVLEYWIVSPQDNNIIVNRLVNGKYVGSRPMVAGDTITTAVLPGFSLDIQAYFEQ